MKQDMVSRTANPAPAWTDRLCDWVQQKKLETPATFLLEIHRPLLPLAWPTAMIFGSVIAPFVGPDYYTKIEALRDPALLDRLLARLAGSRPAGNAPAATSGEHAP